MFLFCIFGVMIYKYLLFCSNHFWFEITIYVFSKLSLFSCNTPVLPLVQTLDQISVPFPIHLDTMENHRQRSFTRYSSQKLTLILDPKTIPWFLRRRRHQTRGLLYCCILVKITPTSSQVSRPQV